MKHWIIRSFFIGLLLLCVTCWGWSRSHWGVMNYSYHGRYLTCQTIWGCAKVGYMSSYPGKEGWDCRVYPAEPCTWPPADPQARQLLGFGYVSLTTGFRAVLVPYWFLLIMFSTILFIVWRKTRPKVKGRAFPVELTEKQP